MSNKIDNPALGHLKANLQDWMLVVILLLAVAALFYRLFLGEVIYWGVPLLQFYPWREMAFSALRAGHLPLWNPLTGMRRSTASQLSDGCLLSPPTGST